jgi:hypothetical protein
MLFPQLSPQYYDQTAKERSILAVMENFYAESITLNQSYWAEGDTDTRFYTGDQSFWNDLYGNAPVNRRRQFTFNRIRRIIEMISGYQRRNRKSTIVKPYENGDSETADQFTKILMWINNQEGVLETISESFRGSLITGMNLLQLWVDYRSDPISGSIKVDNCAYNSFLIDPYFRKPDLSDCNAVWKRTFLTKRECVSLMPNRAEEILGLIGNESGNGRDMKFQFLPESYNYGMKNLLTYDEYYYRDFRTQKMLVDSQTGETFEWKSSDKKEELEYFLSLYPQISAIEQEIPTVKLAIVIQGKVFYDGPNPLGIDRYPFIPVLSYYAPETPYYPYRVQGVVRGLRDAQYLYNRRRIIELDILESQIASGFKYKENALVNPKDVFLQGQGRGLALKDEAAMSDVEQIQPPQVPPSMIQLSELLGREIQEISGVNEELLGSASDDKAGVLSMLRQGAGLTTLQSLFDQLDHSQKMLGQLMMEVIQANFVPGKVQKILEGKQPAPQFYNKAFGKYNAVIEEGLNTSTQKAMQFAQLLELKSIGVPIPNTTLLEAATLQNKKELVEQILAQETQQKEAQKAQLEAQLADIQARTQLAQARATADQGLGIERISRVQENQALADERRAQARKDDEIGLLNLVKSLKELEAMDLSHLQQLIGIANQIKNVEKVEQQIMPQPIAQNENKITSR